MAEDEKDEPKPDDAENEENKDGEDGEESEGEGGEGASSLKDKLGKKKLIIIAAVGGVLLLGGGVGAGMFFGGFFDAKPVAVAADGTPIAEGQAATGEAAHHDVPEADKDKPVSQPVFLALGDILVNLSSSGKRPNFLKIKVSLELADEKDKEALAALKPRIIDNFQVYLRELRVEDLRGSAGLYRLREELLLRVTEAAQPIRIRDVLFQEMLVQ